MKKVNEKSAPKSEEQKMTNVEALQLYADLKLLNDLTGFAFVMAVADTAERIEKEQKVLEKIKEFSDEFKVYQEETRNLNDEFSYKDESGKAKLIAEVVDGQQMQYYDLDKSKAKERKAALVKLNKKHKALIDLQTEKQEKYMEAMAESSTVEKIEIAAKQMPKNISAIQVRIARKFIKIKD